MGLNIADRISKAWRAVRRSTSRRLLAYAAIVSAFGFVLVGAVTLAVSLNNLEQGFTQVSSTERILRHTSLLGANVGSAEAAARGYMLAHESRFLDRLNEDRRNILEEIRVLTVLSRGEPALEDCVTRMRDHLYLHLGSSSAPLVAGAPQLDALLGHLRESGLRMDPNFERPLSQFRDEEFRGLRQRQARAADEATDALIIAVSSLLLALISGTAGLYLMARNRAENELQKVREEFAHVSRLNTMGEVAATLAHDVKQPLTASTNYLSVVKHQLTNDNVAREKVVEVVDKISAQVGRAVDIIQHLRTHVSRTGSSATSETVEQTISEAIALSGIEQGDAAIRIRLEARLPRVCIDKVQIQQVLVNLIRNAMEAVSDCPRKFIRISARRGEHGMVRIEIRDSGRGIPADIRENLFKPFVSTKAHGMGVGLSICRSIIQAHGGDIHAVDAPGGGTIFAFTVPEA